MAKKLSEQAVEMLLQKYKLHNSETEFHRLGFEYENRALRRVREGHYLDVNFPLYEDVQSQLGTTAKDPKRAFEYDTVAAIALFSRAAIEGGAPPDDSLDLSDVLLQEVEKAATIEELYQLYQTAAILFAKLVSNTRRKSVSYQVEQCRVYVAKKIYGKISVKDIAAQVGLSPNYLSRLFRQEEGIGLNDYIQQEKTKLAASLLAQSTQPISFIALYLGFKSQSNFTEVFKKWQGMTPSAYRNQHYHNVASSE